MKILLVETSPIKTANDVTVHVRNSIILCDYLKQHHNCRLVSLETDIIDVEEQFDFIIFISATFYFKYERFVQLMDNQKNCKIGSMLNEYELFINDFLKQRGLDFIITNFVKEAIKKAHKHDKHLVTNLNTLIAKPRNQHTEKLYDICYFGTWRKYRSNYFRKYLINNMILSTSPKNIKKFQLDGCDCFLTDKFSWEVHNETLNYFWGTLGIEDTKTHQWFNFLPNRWYESLFTNTACFFDKTCQGSIDKDVYNIDKWFIVDSYDEIISKINELKNGKDINNHFNINTKIALQEKDKSLKEVEQFLLNY